MKLYGYVKCAKCKGIIHGIPRANKLKKLCLSKKRVNRIFGGYLCSKCVREEIKNKIRNLIKNIV
ncbi:MAG: hypothetical protein QXS69_00915 [Candidatus Aenigmatarchaeota archaeon]